MPFRLRLKAASHVPMRSGGGDWQQKRGGGALRCLWQVQAPLPQSCGHVQRQSIFISGKKSRRRWTKPRLTLRLPQARPLPSQIPFGSRVHRHRSNTTRINFIRQIGGRQSAIRLRALSTRPNGDCTAQKALLGMRPIRRRLRKNWLMARERVSAQRDGHFRIVGNGDTPLAPTD